MAVSSIGPSTRSLTEAPDGAWTATAGREAGGSGTDGLVWIDAAPFRAHLLHVMAVGDLGVDEVAAMAGVPVRAARRLAGGGAGRPARRVSNHIGRRLLRITSADAHTVRRRRISAHGAAALLDQIANVGLSPADVASRTGLSATLVEDIVLRRKDVCSPLVAARVAALHAALDIGDDVQLALG